MGARSSTRPRKGSAPAEEQRGAGSESAGRAVSEVLLGEAAASSSAAMVICDDDLNYIAANDAACEALGYSREHLLRLRVSDIVPKSPSSLEKRAREVAGGRMHRGRTTVRRRDDTSLDVDFVAFASTVAGLPYALTVFWPRAGRRGPAGEVGAARRSTG